MSSQASGAWQVPSRQTRPSAAHWEWSVQGVATQVFPEQREAPQLVTMSQLMPGPQSSFISQALPVPATQEPPSQCSVAAQSSLVLHLPGGRMFVSSEQAEPDRAARRAKPVKARASVGSVGLQRTGASNLRDHSLGYRTLDVGVDDG